MATMINNGGLMISKKKQYAGAQWKIKYFFDRTPVNPKAHSQCFG